MKSIILSFDDSREDFYSNVFPLLKKYQLKATLNVISDFVVHPDIYSEFPSGDNNAMTITQVKECDESGLVEIACHGHYHLNTRNDVLENIHNLQQWGIDTKGIGFASPGSNLTWENKNDNGVWDLVIEGVLGYVRSGLQIRREGLLYSVFSMLDRYIHSNVLFYYLNKRALILSLDGKVTDSGQKKAPFFLSTAIHSHTRLRQIQYLINKAQSGTAIILMFHSVLKHGEKGYGVDRYYYDYKIFEALLNWLAHNDDIHICTTKEFLQLSKIER